MEANYFSSQSFLPQRKQYYRYTINHENIRAQLRLEVTNRLKQIPDTFGQMIGTEERKDYLERCLPFILEKFSASSTQEVLHVTEETFAAVTNHPR